MSDIVDDLPAFLQDLFLCVPDQVNSQLDIPFCQRKRSLTPSSFVRTLVFGWLDDPDASVETLAQYACYLGSAVSESGLRQRFTDSAVDLLAGVLQEALQPLIFGPSCPAPLLERFNGTYLFDSTVIPLPCCLLPLFPGCGNQDKVNAACKLLLGLELGSGGLIQLDLFAARQPDQQLAAACQPLPAGALMIRDLGFFSLRGLRQQDDQGVYYLSRADPRLVVQVGGGQTQSLMQFLRSKGQQVDGEVEVGTKDRLKCRLIAWRVPDAVAETRRQKRLQWAKRKQKRRNNAQQRGKKVAKGTGKTRRAAGKPTAEQLEQCEWVVVLTNVPADKMNVKEAEALLRSRWQIELLIKVWKQSGCLEGIEANKPQRALCELLAKLLGQLVAHWAVLGSGRVYLELDVPQAQQKVSTYAERLGRAIAQGLETLREVWQELQKRLQHVGKRRQGKKRPSTAQRLDGQEPPWFSYVAA
jgi:hypothetical protein